MAVKKKAPQSNTHWAVFAITAYGDYSLYADNMASIEDALVSAGKLSTDESWDSDVIEIHQVFKCAVLKTVQIKESN